MPWEKELIVCGAGFVAGTMNAMAGGGTMVTFPALLWAGLSALQANTTSTVALFLGMPLGAWSFRRHLGGLKHWLRILTPVSVLGGFAGGVLLLVLGGRAFDRIVPWLLLMATVLFMCNGLIARWLRRRLREEPSEHRLEGWGIAAFAAVAIYGGYFGAGIGIMMLATLGLLGLRDMNQMNALKVILAMLMNLAAVLWFIVQGQVEWHWAAWLMIGSIGGYVAGSHLAQRIPGHWVRAIGALIGLGICLHLFLKQWRGF